MFEFFGEKSQIGILSTFDQREFKKINHFDKNVYSVKKGHFLPFLAHCTYFRQNNFFFLFKLIKSTQNNNLRFFPK